MLYAVQSWTQQFFLDMSKDHRDNISVAYIELSFDLNMALERKFRFHIAPKLDLRHDSKVYCM